MKVLEHPDVLEVRTNLSNQSFITKHTKMIGANCIASSKSVLRGVLRVCGKMVVCFRLFITTLRFGLADQTILFFV